MGKDLDQAVRDVVKGAGVVYAGLMIEYAVAFLAQVIAAKYLSVSSFGSVITGTAVVDIGAIVAVLGLSTGLARNLPREESREERLKLAHTAAGIVLPASLVIGAAIVLTADVLATQVFGDPSVASSLRIFGGVVPFAALLNLSIGGIRGQKFSRYRVYLKNLIQPITRTVLVVGAVAYGLSETGFLAAYAVPFVLTGLTGVYLMSRALPGYTVIGRTDLETAVELLRFSLPLSVSTAMNFIVRSADIFLLLYFLDSEAVGIYGVVYALARLILMFSTAFNFLGMPVASELDSAKKRTEVLRVNESILRWLVIVSVPVLFPLLVYPADVIGFIYRPDYASGWVALAVLAAGFAVHNVLVANGSVLTALGATKTIMANDVVAALLNVALNVLLIPRYGITGAAIATVASYLFRDVATVLELRYFTGHFTITRRVLAPVAVAVPVIAAGWLAAPYLPVSFWSVGLLTAAVGVLYVVAILLTLGIAPEEEMLIRSAEEKYGLSLGPFDQLVERFS